MRVPVTTGKDRNQEGAVAILVAVLLIVLVGMVAFAVDGGFAYNHKRQLQTSADAAALAGAAVYLEQPGDCLTLDGNIGLEADAKKAANDMMAQNHDTATETDFDVYCDPNTVDGRIHVLYSNEADVETQFGRVLGVDTMTPETTAVANIGERQGQGIRPVAMCNNEVPDEVAMPQMGRVEFEGHVSADPCDGSPGNWREIDCPAVDNNGTPSYVAAINHGCSSDVRPVPSQPPAGDPTLDDHLLNACPPGPPAGQSDEDCLGGNTGHGFNNQVRDAWIGLLDETIFIPVVCDPVDCPPAGAFRGSGDTAQFPIYQIVEVVVCGVNKGSGPVPAKYGTSSDCTGASLEAGASGDPWLVLNFLSLITWDDPDPVVGASESVQLVE